MPNYDGEYEVRIFYSTTPVGYLELEHVLTFDVKIIGSPTPGTDFESIDTETPDGTNPPLGQVVDDLIAQIDGLYPAATEFTRAELWYAEEATENFTFISAYIIGVVGTNSAGSSAAGQITMTFRSLGGGIMRLQFMEPSSVDNTVDSYPFTGLFATIANLIVNTGQPYLARDNTRPIAPNKVSQTQNEALYRRRFRST